jgi:hypothetical protein
MPASNTYETKFIIGAKFIGKPAFSQLDRALWNSLRGAKAAVGKFAGMFGAFTASIGASAVAYLAFRKTFDLGAASYEAATEVKKAYDIVAQANAKLVQEGRLSAKSLQKQTEETVALAEALGKAGGIDAETLAVGLAGLTRSFSSDQIKALTKGWQDWMVTVHKGAPTFEQAQEDAKMLEEFVIAGRVRGLKGLNITEEQREALGKLNTVQERGAALAKILAKETGALAEWMKTDAGVAYVRQQAGESFLETVGKPMVEATRDLNIAMTELLKAMDPVAKLIAAQLKPALQDLANWIKTNKDEIVIWAKRIVGWTKWWTKGLVDSLTNTYNQSVWLWEHVIISFEDTKAQWLAVVDWIDRNVIKPIYNLFYWLWQKIDWLWQKIVPKLPGAKSTPAQEAEAQRAWDKFYQEPGGGTQAAREPTTEATAETLGSTEPNPEIAAERAKVMEQLKEPGMRELVAATLAQEASTAEGRADVLESLVNRAVVQKKHPRELITAGGRAGSFYGPYRRGEVQAALAKGMSQAALAEYDAAAAAVAAGRNRIQGRIDQGMRREVRRLGRIKVAGEYYGFWNKEEESKTAAYRAAQKLAEGPTKAAAQKLAEEPTKPAAAATAAETAFPYGGLTSKKSWFATEEEEKRTEGKGPNYPVEVPPKKIVPPAAPVSSDLRQNLRSINMPRRIEGAAPTNVSMNPTINVNGVAAGSEELVADRIKRVVQNNSKDLIAQLKQARSYESRLGYV